MSSQSKGSYRLATIPRMPMSRALTWQGLQMLHVGSAWGMRASLYHETV